jgi:uncharacterized protein YciI
MFIILLNYKKPLADVELYLDEHRRFLDEGYQGGFFLASGPKNPRDGGVIISHLKDREQLEAILHQDPFYIHEIATYQLIEFIPNKYHPDFARFMVG